ncbi:MAG: CBS domain-containing protein [Desulfobaccales bacterium]
MTEETLATAAPSGPPELSDADIYEAMKEIPGYLDITPGSFKEVYRLAFRLARKRLFEEVTAAHLMTREVIAVRPETPVEEVAQAMGRAGISGVPVVDGENRVVGVISERDFLQRMGAKEGNFMSLVALCLKTRGCVAVPIKEKRAADLMSAPAVTVAPDTPLREILQLFDTRHINRVPVADAAGRLQGIITRGDLIRVLGGLK